MNYVMNILTWGTVGGKLCRRLMVALVCCAQSLEVDDLIRQKRLPATNCGQNVLVIFVERCQTLVASNCSCWTGPACTLLFIMIKPVDAHQTTTVPVFHFCCRQAVDFAQSQ